MHEGLQYKVTLKSELSGLRSDWIQPRSRWVRDSRPVLFSRLSPGPISNTGHTQILIFFFFFFFVILSESASAQAYQENGSFPNTHQATGSPLPGPNDPVPSPPSRPAAPGSRAEGRARPSQCGPDPQQGPDPALSCSDSITCSCWGLSPAQTLRCDSVLAGPPELRPRPCPCPCSAPALTAPGPVLPEPQPFPVPCPAQTLHRPRPQPGLWPCKPPPPCPPPCSVRPGPARRPAGRVLREDGGP